MLVKTLMCEYPCCLHSLRVIYFWLMLIKSDRIHFCEIFDILTFNIWSTLEMDLIRWIFVHTKVEREACYEETSGLIMLVCRWGKKCFWRVPRWRPLQRDEREERPNVPSYRTAAHTSWASLYCVPFPLSSVCELGLDYSITSGQTESACVYVCACVCAWDMALI